MRFNQLLQYIVISSLFIATVGTAYIFISTVIFKETSFAGFYTSWQFPTLLAIFIDAAFYKHINKLNTL